MKDLRDRTAVLTGGASGIGRAMAERFTEDRARNPSPEVHAPPHAKKDPAGGA